MDAEDQRATGTQQSDDALHDVLLEGWREI
jgi:hypothetical protein